MTTPQVFEVAAAISSQLEERPDGDASADDEGFPLSFDLSLSELLSFRDHSIAISMPPPLSWVWMAINAERQLSRSMSGSTNESASRISSSSASLPRPVSIVNALSAAALRALGRLGLAPLAAACASLAAFRASPLTSSPVHGTTTRTGCGAGERPREFFSGPASSTYR